MDMKERLQELAEAARKRIEESDGPDKPVSYTHLDVYKRQILRMVEIRW